MAFKVPEEYYYTKDHEWALVEENIVTVGVTEFALDALGEVVYLEIPDEGQKVSFQEPFGVVESVKAVSDLIAPISGTVVESNAALVDNPGRLNDNPWEDGWLIKIEMDKENELSSLIKASEYKKLTAQ